MNVTEKKDTTYNGWTNYETWNVALWIGNEEGSYRYWRERAQEIYEQSKEREYATRDEAAIYNLADALKEDFKIGKEEFLEDAAKSSSVWADLLGAALSEVDWQEIASGMIEEVDKAETDQE